MCRLFQGAAEAKAKGIELLKRISREPWWNKHAPLTVSEALSQIIGLLPRAGSKLYKRLLDYLVEISQLVSTSTHSLKHVACDDCDCCSGCDCCGNCSGCDYCCDGCYCCVVIVLLHISCICATKV